METTTPLKNWRKESGFTTEAAAKKLGVTSPMWSRWENGARDALINYGRCSASKIGAAHGVSRNVIIGHWNRLRAKGLLPPINHEPRSVA